MNLICPVCRAPLENGGRCFACAQNHSFDIAKEGYVNLLLSSKSGSLTGDSRSMALARRDFLGKGYFEILARAVKSELESRSQSVSCAVDICCGEGYYTQVVSDGFDGEFYGFDISKEMIRLAAKRKSRAFFAVANMKNLPLRDECADFAMHLFAPFCEQEFARILSPGGVLVCVRPGKRHLFEIKQKVYDVPYENDETPQQLTCLNLLSRKRLLSEVNISSNQDIQALFAMTPYYYRTSAQNRSRLDGIDSLDVTLDFIIEIFNKR